MKTIKILALGIILISAFSFGQVNAQDNKKAVQEQVTGPSINFENTTHDYGTINKGANGDCEFVFVNQGTEPLLISDVRASCGCTTPSWTREPIMPGKKGSIKVHYDTNRIGGISKSVTVTTNGNPERAILRIVGNILDQTASN